MIKIEKNKLNRLINELIKTGGGQSAYVKFSELLKIETGSDNISVLRRTILLWLDSMMIFDVNFPNYTINKPSWVQSSVKGQYNLIGALTINEIKLLNQVENIKTKPNIINYEKYEIELPDTYYTDKIDSVNHLGFKILDAPIFSNIDNDPGITEGIMKLRRGILSISETEGRKRITFEENDSGASVPIENQDFVQIFDWRSRKYTKCNLKFELDDEEGDKLIKVEKKKSDSHYETYTLFLVKVKGNPNWNYAYFDSDLIDERWARFIYLQKLAYYDLHRGVTDFEKLGALFINLRLLHPKNSVIKLDENVDYNSKNIIPVEDVLKKQFIKYDVRNKILAVPITLPLPKLFMKYLFSCSGVVPKIYAYNFSKNPNYKLKLLYSGILSENGKNIAYPDEKYFMIEDLYLFSAIPKELAEDIAKKFNLDYYKITFLKDVK